VSDKERQFFDQIAERWDDLRSAAPPLIAALVAMVGLREGDRVLDVGCGTGVLVPYVKKAVGAAGAVTAVDFAANMIARAAQKHKDLAGVDFVAADIMDYQAESLFDKIICFNFFPHASDKPAFLLKMAGLLSTGGAFVIMHDLPRATVNSIHGGCDAVKDDRLPAGARTAELLTQAGLSVTDVIDNDELYFVKAVRK
jgi:demethylmenaquinone methyltransferase/2-methoxy-6-polyprenyl-1,4-benzoquinol methylase